MNIKKKKAVVLLSGGLDSSTVLWLVKREFTPYCLIIDYGQRHRKEINLAKKIAEKAGSNYKTIKLSLPANVDSLTNKKKALPQRNLQNIGSGIPSTYVPGRNIIFLSLAVSYAEAIGAETVFIGANSVDFSGYPDCTPSFLEAFNKMVRKGTKAGVSSKSIKIKSPILRKSKAQIIKIGTKLGLPYEITWSCYRGGNKPCGKCDSCRLRAEGFEKAGLKDPLVKT